MEKMIWTRPIAEVEQFMPNEYIAKCEDTTTEHYKFVCNASGGITGTVMVDSNGNGKYDPFVDKYLGTGYHQCQATHYVSKEGTEILKGFYLTGFDALTGSGKLVTPVFIWRGNDGNNIHCTKYMGKELEVVKGNKS